MTDTRESLEARVKELEDEVQRLRVREIDKAADVVMAAITDMRKVADEAFRSALEGKTR